MGIIEALKNINHDLRLINGNKWMVWNDDIAEWEVIELKRGKTLGIVILSTDVESVAIDCLLAN